MSESPVPSDKSVTWAELFFDLVFVLAITQVSALLHLDHSWAGASRAAIVFALIYWVWVGTTVQSNSHDMELPRNRMALFAVALCGLFMALAVPAAYDGRGLIFALAYWVARLMLVLMLFGRSLRRLTPYTISAYLTGPLLVVGALLGQPARELAWLVAALADVAMPTVMRRRLSALRFDAGHLTERFGLFLLIAIGESVVAAGAPAAAAEHVSAGVLAAVAAAFALCCGLWWVYFHFAAGAMQHALSVAEVQLVVTRHVLSYAHLMFVAAIISVAVGMAETIDAPGEALSRPIAGLLFGGCALYLATFGYTRWMMFHLVSKTRLSAAALTLVLLPLATSVPALAALALLALTVAVLNLVEYRMGSTGRTRSVAARAHPGQ